jgi:hypothetical protein
VWSWVQAMGFWLRAGAWIVGIGAVVISALVVYNAFFGPQEDAPLAPGAARVCPPHVSAPARAPGAPVDDNVGLRPGFSIADARAVLLCRDENFDMQYEQIWHTPVPSNLRSRQRMFAVRPQERLALGIVGQPEHEIVYAIFQDIAYRDTAVTVTPQATAADLIGHYGPPHDRKEGGARIDLWWMYGPDGKPLKAPVAQGTDPFSAFTGWIAGSWSMGSCEQHVKIDPLSQASWSGECGLSIHAQIEIRKDDPTRIARYRIVAIDQARLGAAVEAYRERLGAPSPTR